MIRIRYATILFLLTTSMCPLVLNAQTRDQRAAQPDSESPQVRFAFSGTPWRTVIQWLADEGGYALHVNDLPLGSFTYSDQRSYSIDEAINRINLFLIPRRYTLVRSGELLSVVSLDDETSVRQLEVMARVAKPEQLAGLGDQDVVKCFFPLGDLLQETAIEELSGLMLIREPTVLKHTNQLLVLDTAKNLRTVQAVLTSLSTPSVAAGPVKRFSIGHRSAEDVLIQVRPHVGLEPLAMTGADIRLSVDRERGQILASGSPENIQAVANVIALLEHVDKPASPIEQSTFQTHDIGGADLQAVVNVLLTLLADEDIPLEAIPKTNQIAVLGPEHVHDTIKETIKQLTGTNDAFEFRVLSVESIDPRYAAVVLNDMFVSPAPEEQLAVGTSQERPRIDVDPRTRRLFVRARRSQLDAIEEALGQLAGDQHNESTERLRLLRFQGVEAVRLVEAARRFWPYEEILEVIAPQVRLQSQPVEREIRSAPTKNDPSQSRRDPVPTMTQLDDVFGERQPHGLHNQTVLTSLTEPTSRSGREDDSIQIQVTPSGILIRGDSKDAVQRTEQHLKLIASAADGPKRSQAVFYLKHAKVIDANRLLQQVLAEESSWDDSLSTLSTNVGVSEIGGSWSFNSATVVPDSRLNRIFAFGRRDDLDRIESHLEIIDREDSITELKTHGTPRVVILQHARAEDVAAVIRDAYSGRIASSAKERAAAANAAKPDRSSDNNAKENASDDRKPKPQRKTTSSDETEMTLALDSASNAIVITAPNQLAQQVEALAKRIDRESEKTVKVLPLKGIQDGLVQQTLQQMFGDRIHSGDAAPSPNRQ